MSEPKAETADPEERAVNRLPGFSRGAGLDAPERVPITALRPADSPRLSGEVPDHVTALSESVIELPPIVVHRPTMRVVDGMHRLRAAGLRGDTEISVRYFDGTEEAAFLLAVTLNIEHGLPLSLADREAAASRVIEAHAHWSNRRIALAVGLSDKTIATIRKRAPAGTGDTARRIGKDGRARPLNSAEGRKRAGDLFAANPDLTIREVSALAGISVGTTADVLKRLRLGKDPVPPKQRGEPGAAEPAPEASDRLAHLTSSLRVLRADPSLRYSDQGRALLRRLEAQAMGPEQWNELAASVPQHCRDAVVDLAHACAAVWGEFAERLTADRPRPDTRVRQRAKPAGVKGYPNSA
ncbi:ParB/RepB/Spo0J family partition protein [Amycolatopsis sp. CA-230715]|uniref:ParB/RepB/Spo0J family partition protein n=1 Tax=Amycolatopsis sp. CA-230715 TaxID=2745196 RepID=UPI001C02B16B|nr:ParB/RepB/Spo0J family partition protein [Amycolatopsis sp. CA-230715]QWF82032.1 Transcriptional regulator NovG [Amycolatopsis sp. CA-230715]